MIHIHAIWLNNGSKRSQRLARKHEEAERELRLTKQLLEELEEDKRSKYWWVS